MKALVVAGFLALFVVRVPETEAQVDSTLQGKRARVRVSDLHRQAEFLPKVLELRGTVAGVSPDTVVLLIPNITSPLHIPRANILNLAVSRGVPSRLESAARRGVWWGLFGACLGLISPMRDSGDAWEAVGTGASVGVLTGLIVGTVSPYERWRRIRIR